MADSLQLDWSNLEQLLRLALDYKTKLDARESIDLREAIDDVGTAVGIEDVDAFVHDKVNNAMHDGLNFAFEGDAVDALAAPFVENCVPIMNQVLAFTQGKETPAELFDALETFRISNTTNIEAALKNALGVPDGVDKTLADKFGPYLVSIYCLAATYKIYEKAARDAAIAKERRIEAERLAAETMAQLKAQRAEMDQILNTYLLDRLVPFSAGVTAMDKAIMENDDDGFIRANEELWQVFGRTAQYHNAAEFDELMSSDETFKL